MQRKGIRIHPHLRPGLSTTQVQTAISRLGFMPPPELIELYAWHDGVDDTHAPEMLFGEQQFLPLSEAFNEYHELLRHYDQNTTAINLAACFPFAGFQGSVLALYCLPTTLMTLQHPIIEIYHSIFVAFETLDQMAQTVDAWFAAGVYDARPVDDARRLTIRKRLNPRLPNRTETL